MKRFFIIFALLAIVAGASASEVFINWRAGYYVTMPDDWHHVPYSTVNIFLKTQNVNSSDFDYDAVIAKKTDKPFFTGPYIFLVTHEVGELNDNQIDSVLKEISNDYQKRFEAGTLDRGDKTFKQDSPIYDKSLKAVATKSRVTSEFTDKYLMDIRKFYKKGIAIFLCYAPKEQYNDGQVAFIDILNSFSTEDLESMAPKDSAQFVDVSEKELSGYNEDDFPESGNEGGLSGTTKSTIYIVLLGLIVIVIILIFIRKKKK